MTYGDAKSFVTAFLRGDNSNPDVQALHFKMALMETATLCEPSTMVHDYTGSETDVFRMLHPVENDNGDFVEKYIRIPAVPLAIDDAEAIPIDPQLDLAIVYFVCSYLSNKYKEKYEQKAEKIIQAYTSNKISL